MCFAGPAGASPAAALTPAELAKRCGLVFQFPERYLLGDTLQQVGGPHLSASATCLSDYMCLVSKSSKLTDVNFGLYRALVHIDSA